MTQLQIPWANLPRSDLGAFAPDESRWLAFFKSIAGALLLPYRIWRSWQYDQAYHTDPDGGEDLREEWVQRQRNSSWSRQIGLDRAPKSGLLPSVGLPEDRPIVAILDTGIDYNHAALHSALWVSPDEPADSEGVRARYGWDFISGDSRPFDDHDHGTELASLVTAIEPEARILPLKVFNPWGVTHSGALVSAFRFAVQHGASVIVCGWATRHDSEALEEAVRLAQTAGVLVVAAAGDRGEDLGKVPAYPAALSKQFPGTVLTVANVDAQDRRVQVSGHFSNFNSEIVGIAAPGSGVEVLRPRLREAKPAPSSAYAAALVAGAAVRWGREMTAAQRIDRLLRESYAVPGLASEVKGGARLQIRGAPF